MYTRWQLSRRFTRGESACQKMWQSFKGGIGGCEKGRGDRLPHLIAGAARSEPSSARGLLTQLQAIRYPTTAHLNRSSSLVRPHEFGSTAWPLLWEHSQRNSRHDPLKWNREQNRACGDVGPDSNINYTDRQVIDRGQPRG